MDQHDAGLVGTLCLDHIALPPQAHHRLMASHFDLASDEPSSDDDLEVKCCLILLSIAASLHGHVTVFHLTGVLCHQQ